MWRLCGGPTGAPQGAPQGPIRGPHGGEGPTGRGPQGPHRVGGCCVGGGGDGAVQSLINIIAVGQEANIHSP